MGGERRFEVMDLTSTEEPSNEFLMKADFVRIEFAAIPGDYLIDKLEYLMLSLS